jgi:anti-repressor protein
VTAPVLFEYGEREVRIVEIDGEPWFVAADVCAVLGIADAASSVRSLDDDERGPHSMRTRGGDLLVVVVSEAGLYSLILRSRKPEAKPFKRWVTHEVLPAIRRTGSYGVAPAIPQTYAEALRAYADEVEARELAQRKVAELEPAAEQFHRWQTSPDTVYVVEWAKTIGLTQSEAYRALRELGVLFKQQHEGAAFNVPKRGWEVYFDVIDEWIPQLRRYQKVPKITAAGQVVLAELLMENGWIAP